MDGKIIFPADVNKDSSQICCRDALFPGDQKDAFSLAQSAMARSDNVRYMYEVLASLASAPDVERFALQGII